MVIVYHNDKFVNYVLAGPPLKDTTVRKVASITTDSLDEAFQLSNHIDHRWTENPEVLTSIKPSDSVRSTSVGDVLDLNGSLYVVEPEGFRPITREEESSITFCIPE